ncbi:MAG: hypothetical protein RBQ97_00620 [Acholeplasma sp.]|nr:hypothetical protein [Acholeplasma sp.]
MKKKYDANLFQENVNRKINNYENEFAFPSVFYDAINQGKTLRKQFEKLEYKKFDEDWIVTLESFFPSIDKITRNLRSALRYEAEILPIEKTRRTNPESIRHLIQNTRYIREVTDEDGIIPEKVLNSLSEIEYGIYENRFIMTLVTRLNDYLFNRLKVIKENMHGFKETNFDLSNDFYLNNANYNITISLKALEEMDLNDIDEHNRRVYERVESAYKIVSRMYHSDFMRIMMRYKPVKAPIMKTQIILKNPDFRNAYLMWLYLDRIHVLDYTLESEIRKKRFNKEYHKQLDQSLLYLFSTIFTNSNLGSANSKDEKVTNKSIKPKADEDLEYSTNALLDTDVYDMEPMLATEYYLKKAKQMFSKRIEELNRNSSSPAVAIKQILLDQYAIADQVFNFYFETNQDADIFSKIITYADPVKRYEEMLERYKITKIAREVKENLYKDAYNLEDKWIKEIVEIQETALDSLKEKGLKETDAEIVSLTKEVNKDLLTYERELKTKNKILLKRSKESTDSQIKKINKKYSDDLKRFKAKEKERLAKEKEKQRERKLKELERIKLKRLKEREKEKERLRNKKIAAEKNAKTKLSGRKKLIKDEVDRKIKNS